MTANLARTDMVAYFDAFAYGEVPADAARLDETVDLRIQALVITR